MNNALIKAVIILVLSFISARAQSLSPEEKQKLIMGLTNINPDSAYSEYNPTDCALKISQYKVIEAEAALISNFWIQPREYTRLWFLYALDAIGYNRIQDFTLEYLDTLSKDNKNLEIKAGLNKILFAHGDFSRRHYIYEYLESNNQYIDLGTLFLLLKILDYDKNDIQAKNYVILFAKQAELEHQRWFAISQLYSIYKDELIDFFIERENLDLDWTTRDLIIDRILSNYETLKIHEALRDRLSKEVNDQVKLTLEKLLLRKYSTIEDYLLAERVLPSVKDTFYYSCYYSELDCFEVSGDGITQVTIMLDTLSYYTTKCISLSWLGNNDFSVQLKNIISEAQQKIISGDSLGTAVKIKQYQSLIERARKDSTAERFVTSDGYKFLYYYPQYILERLPKIPTVKLENSSGMLLPGGSLQYYESAWKDAVDNGDGTFSVNTQQKTVSLRMTYAYGSQTKSNVTVGPDTVVFQTVNTQVKLQNGQGIALDTGKVQYYAGAWREFGTTSNGVVAKELLPNNYSFRMTYAYASNDKQQNIGTDPNVIFKTVNANVQLQNSLGSTIDLGTVQYYAGAWRDFGTTSNGVVTKELLPNNYSFRMTYAYASNDKQQNIGTDPNVIFKTVNANVQLQNSLGAFIDQGTVQYYAGAWREFGTTSNGVITKELLPNNYSFRMTHDYISKDVSQNIGTNNIVKFSTVLCTIRAKDAQNNLLNNAAVSYYAGAWRQIGLTVNGEITKELLPANLSFRANYNSVQKDKTQDISTNGIVEFTF